MLASRENLIEICTALAEQEQLEVTLIETSKGALMAGFGALSGGLLAGPVGLAIGGTIGSILAAWRGQGKYKSVVEVIKNDMTPQQQQKLAEAVQRVISNVNVQDFQGLLLLVLTSGSMKEMVLKEMGTFLLKELSLSIK